MDILEQFATNNLLLIVVWFVLFYMIVNSFVKGVWDRSPQEVVQLLNQSNSLILDVRENNEYKDGHIIDSLHIPMGDVKNRLSELDKYKQGNVIVSCRSGHRSARICSLLKKKGYENIFNLKGGIMAWESDKLPITKAST